MLDLIRGHSGCDFDIKWYINLFNEESLLTECSLEKIIGLVLSIEVDQIISLIHDIYVFHPTFPTALELETFFVMIK